MHQAADQASGQLLRLRQMQERHESTSSITIRTDDEPRGSRVSRQPQEMDQDQPGVKECISNGERILGQGHG